MMKEDVGIGLKDIIILVVVTSLVTGIVTWAIIYNQNRLTRNTTIQDLSKDEDMKEFLKVYASIVEDYYEDIDKKEMLEKAIAAMVNYLGEDYTTYMDKDETNSLLDKLKGEYTGIGIQLSKDDNVIRSFVEGGDAINSGLKIGDIVIKINDTDVNSSEDISKVIEKTKSGTKVKLTVKRNEEVLSFDVENKNILIPAISYDVVEDNIGYLKIEVFSETLAEQVNFALNDMESRGIKSLIIDVRDNTGGYLGEAREVASMFLEKGKLIYSLEDRNKSAEVRDETNEKRDYKVVVLINESSASASEVLAAALKESYNAVTVGKKSYGKGKVQQAQALDDGSMAKYTTSRWLTPNGNCIDGIGIKPDYEIEQDENSSFDTQLEKALELVVS